MKIDCIAPGISYVGVNDRHTELFENLWPLPAGVTYNSYLVEGREATALIDGTEVDEVEALCAHLAECGRASGVDYLVVNHMEPDHSGGIPELLRRFPAMKMVGNRQTLDMAAGFYGIGADRTVQVADGQTIDLGGRSLQFFLTPMVHWPETMMTWCAEEKTLFSGDAFGGFGAVDGSPLDTQTDTAPYFGEMYRYYACIVAKYGRFVRNAIAKVGGLPIETICSTHGLVWRRHLAEVVDLYSRLASYTPEEGTVIVCGSMYGNTLAMADYLARKVAEAGKGPVKVHRAGFSAMSDILSDCIRYRSIAIGTPTYSMELLPPVEALLVALRVREVANKRLAAFTSYAWAPNVALKRIEEHAAAMGLPLLAKAQMKQFRFDDVRADLDAMARALTGE